jgi:hypothetical protein
MLAATKLTYQNMSFISAWSWTIIEKPPIVQLAKTFWKFYGTCRFINMFTRPLYWSLTWVRSIQSILLHSILLWSILTLSTHLGLGLSHSLFSSGFPTNILHAFPFYPTMQYAFLISSCFTSSFLSYLAKSISHQVPHSAGISNFLSLLLSSAQIYGLRTVDKFSYALRKKNYYEKIENFLLLLIPTYSGSYIQQCWCHFHFTNSEVWCWIWGSHNGDNEGY